MSNNPAMISKSNLKLIRSLRQKKYRDQQGLFLVEGEKMVMELVTTSKQTGYFPEMVFASDAWIREHENRLGKAGIVPVEASGSDLARATNLVTPQQVIALARIPQQGPGPRDIERGTILGFEAVRDPGNLGTIIRTADWFGIREILCTPDSVDRYNPKVVQSTMGSLFRVRVSYTAFEPLLGGPSMIGRRVYGTFLDGENIYHGSMGEDPVILFGNESRGLSEKYDPFIHKKIYIPSFGTSSAESLNLAASVAVVCSEIRRRE